VGSIAKGTGVWVLVALWPPRGVGTTGVGGMINWHAVSKIATSSNLVVDFEDFNRIFLTISEYANWY